MDVSSSSLLRNTLLATLVVAVLYIGKGFLLPLVIGGILSTFFLPFCSWLVWKKIPNILAVFICFLVLVSSIVLIITLLGWKIADLIVDIDQIKQKATDGYFVIQDYIFKQSGISAIQQTEILKDEKPSFSNIIQITFGSISSLFANTILSLLYFVFLLHSRAHIRNFFVKQVPITYKAEMEQTLNSVAKVSQQYLLGLSKMIACLWIMYGIGFSIVGIDNVLFFAILCGMLEIVPYFGNISGTILTVLISVLHGADSSMVLGILIVYAIVQSIQGWVLEPLILGPQVKINPLFSVIALVLGQTLWGISGIILAIPLLGMVKIICDHVESLRPIGFLIGEVENPKRDRNKEF
jgi:predicted PurR-regulated permease PerM